MSLHDEISASIQQLSSAPGPSNEGKPIEPPAVQESSDNLPRVPAKPEAGPGEEKPAEQLPETKPPETKSPETKVKAPVSWKPEIRQHWDTLPPDVQAEVLRRETEIQSGLSTTASDRKFAAEIREVIAPYEHMFRAEGTTASKAIAAVMQTAALLRTGSPVSKAQAVAELIGQYGIDVGMLDQYLVSRSTGKPPQIDLAHQLQELVARELSPIKEALTRNQQAAAQKIETEVSSFMSDPANEYASDVAEDMADLLEAAERRGAKLSLQEAYNRATLAHPSIGPLVARKRFESEAAQRTAAASRAANASASLPSSGAPIQEKTDDDGSIGSALRQSIRQLSSR
jgi:hypothetical protein